MTVLLEYLNHFNVVGGEKYSVSEGLIAINGVS